MPVWLSNEAAWMALAISLCFLCVALVMHRVFVRVLKGSPSSPASDSSPPQPTPSA